MKAVCMGFAALLCACALGLCAWIARGVMLAPATCWDESIAQVCGFAHNRDDIDRLSTLAESIKSPWWREYAKSRLWSPTGENLKPIQIFEQIIKAFRRDDIRAFVLAREALDCPKLESTFVTLGARDAEFAKIIFAINKGGPLSQKQVENFWNTHLKGLNERRRDYYRGVLIAEALRNVNVPAANALMPTYGGEKRENVLYFAIKGVGPKLFTGLKKENLTGAKRVWSLRNSKAEISKEELLESLIQNDKKLSPYAMYLRKMNCAVYLELGERKRMCDGLKNIYVLTGKNSKVAKLNMAAAANIVDFLGTYGEWDLARLYIYAYAGNREKTLKLIGVYALAAARMGRVDEAVDILEYYNSFCGRVDIDFSRPTYPENAIY